MCCLEYIFSKTVKRNNDFWEGMGSSYGAVTETVGIRTNRALTWFKL